MTVPPEAFVSEGILNAEVLVDDGVDICQCSLHHS